MMWRLVDGGGEIWSDLPSLYQRYRVDPRRVDFVNYAIKNLGFIAFLEMPRAMHVKLRPRVVSPVALIAMIYRLNDHAPDRTVISEFDAGWRPTLVASVAAAIDHLTKLADGLAKPCVDHLRRARRSTDDLRRGSALCALFHGWRDQSHVKSVASFEERLPVALRDRYMVLEPVGDGTLLIRHVGHGFRIFSRWWVEHAVGLRFVDQPDYYYARWAAEAYQDAIARDGPVVDDVDADVDRGAGIRTRARYQRLILPFTHPSGRTWLLGASTLDDSIDLRSKAG